MIERKIPEDTDVENVILYLDCKDEISLQIAKATTRPHWNFRVFCLLLLFLLALAFSIDRLAQSMSL